MEHPNIVLTASLRTSLDMAGKVIPASETLPLLATPTCSPLSSQHGNGSAPPGPTGAYSRALRPAPVRIEEGSVALTTAKSASEHTRIENGLFGLMSNDP
jgi:hypothetical protein